MAKQSFDDGHATRLIKLVPLGTVALDHDVPPSLVVRMTPVSGPVPYPTATQFLAEEQAIPVRSVMPVGMVSGTHVFPPSLVAKRTAEALREPTSPTARQSLVDVHAISDKELACELRSACVVQFEPPLVVVRTTPSVPCGPSVPTATQSLAEGHVMELKTALAGAAGYSTLTDHAASELAETVEGVQNSAAPTVNVAQHKAAALRKVRPVCNAVRLPASHQARVKSDGLETASAGLPCAI